nr:MAG TPA: hypothetical protein [Bacteriophage sp.]
MELSTTQEKGDNQNQLKLHMLLLKIILQRKVL